MKKETLAIYNDLFTRYQDLEVCKQDILKAFDVIAATLKEGHKLLLCGNGGSSSDAEHIVGELLKNFKKHRKN